MEINTIKQLYSSSKVLMELYLLYV